MLILRRLYSKQSGSSKYARRASIDPGISRQRKLIAETQEDISENDIEELESDFMNVHQSHKEHERQMEKWKEKEKYLIVKRKYFKETFPNFLTWHDKEQIKYLHNDDPEDWTIEKLSESFPALPEIIGKVVRGKWTKKNQAKIAAHDRVVIEHWSDFKHGKLNNLPEELKEHLQKFTNRSLNLTPFEVAHEKKIVQNNETKKPGEFSEIIESYQRLQSKNDNTRLIDSIQEDTMNNIENRSNEVDTLRRPHDNVDRRLVTFSELKQNVEKDISRGKNVSIQEQLIVKETQSLKTPEFNTTVLLKPEEISNIMEHRHEVNRDQVGLVQKTTRDVLHLRYPEKISIPKKHYKKGYTYKLNDCYYDCDGEFLYRVPGMS